MKNQNNRRVYVDKDGCEYHKDKYFIGGKMKFRRVYLIDGIPADEFYEKNTTVIDRVLDGDYH